MKLSLALAISATIIGFTAQAAHAAVTLTGNFSTWSAQSGIVTELDFNLGSAQILSSQYESLGVTFPDGDDYVAYFEQADWTTDKWVLADSWGDLKTTFLFTQPQIAVGFKFGTGHFFRLYAGESLIYSSPEFGLNPFIGAISTIPFDRMVVGRSSGGPFVDTVWFGGTVPGPAGLAVLLGASLCGRRRSRRLEGRVRPSR
jgi:hypothetical protein